jgi:hypothetical protein
LRNLLFINGKLTAKYYSMSPPNKKAVDYALEGAVYYLEIEGDKQDLDEYFVVWGAIFRFFNVENLEEALSEKQLEVRQRFMSESE